MITDKSLLENGYKFFNLKNYNQDYYNELIKNSYNHSCSEMLQNLSTFSISGYSSLNEDELRTKLSFENFPFKYDFFISDNESNKLKNRDFTHRISITSDSFDNSRIVSEMIIRNYLYDISQYWFENNYRSDDALPVVNIIKKIQKDIVSTHYNVDVNSYFDDNWKVQHTYFPKNSFIISHADGQNLNRLCAILIYLSDNHKVEWGGNLILNQGELAIPPKSGNVAILDFTKHNVEHAVDKLKSDYGRYTYLSFIEY